VLPEHCRVRGTINPRVGYGGREFGIGFELRLPSRLERPLPVPGRRGHGRRRLTGRRDDRELDEGPALLRGFAVVSTDAGHSGSPVDSSFGLDQQARIDYAYNALDKVTVEAKRLLEASMERRRVIRTCSAARTAGARR
jgi:feruloyl esterase